MRALQSDISRYYIPVVKVGYFPSNREESNLLFQLVSYRYEKSSTIFTANKFFAGSHEVMASAVPDRILHHFYEKVL